MSAAVRCAPPDNKPTVEEIRTCRPYLERELALLEQRSGGGGARAGWLSTYTSASCAIRAKLRGDPAFVFAHKPSIAPAHGQPLLISSYHPSQQNTSTGKLTESMFRAVFRARPARTEEAVPVNRYKVIEPD